MKHRTAGTSRGTSSGKRSRLEGRVPIDTERERSARRIIRLMTSSPSGCDEGEKVGSGVVTIMIAATGPSPEFLSAGSPRRVFSGSSGPVGIFSGSVPLAGTVATDDLAFAARPAAGTGVLPVTARESRRRRRLRRLLVVSSTPRCRRALPGCLRDVVPLCRRALPDCLRDFRSLSVAGRRPTA